jgi:flavin reductase (DIM6/NTAB) family NADH-FMN oxidoreductase RutF
MPSTISFDAMEFRRVIGHFMSGVAVVGTSHAGRNFGMTASSVSSLSLEPPMLVVCLNMSSPTQSAIAGSGRFSVSVLEQTQSGVAQLFAAPHRDKYASVGFHYGEFGQPLLDDALACLECEVADSMIGGTHRVFLGAVRSAHVREGSPLAYYRGRFGRLQHAQQADGLGDSRDALASR